MSFVTLKQMLAIIISILSSIFAIMNFLRKKKDSKGEYIVSLGHKIVLFLIALVVISFVSLSAYLEFVNRDQICADLVLTVADPLIVNKGGSQRDRFLPDEDFCVVEYSNRFIVDATVELENIYTKEKYMYHPISDNGSFTFVNFKSGTYRIKISTGKKEIYEETVVLNRSNVLTSNGKDVWYFTAFLFDDFYEKTVNFPIYLSGKQFDYNYPVFTLHHYDDELYSFSCVIFSSEIDIEHNDKLAGQFYGYPGRYELNNAVTNTEMEPIIFDVGA